jgi:hypothetical protein
MEFPHPDTFQDWREWARHLLSQLRRIKDYDLVEGPPLPSTRWQEIGAAGCPAYGVNWSWHNSFMRLSVVRYDGIVYWRGGCTSATGIPNIITTVPDGLRPTILFAFHFVYPASTVLFNGANGNITHVAGPTVGIYFDIISYPGNRTL